MNWINIALKEVHLSHEIWIRHTWHKELDRRGTLTTLVVHCTSVCKLTCQSVGGSFTTELVKEKSTNWHVAGTWWEFTGMLNKPVLDWTGLDCGKLDQIVLVQRCIYTHTLITEVNRNINLLSWASMGYHKVASLKSPMGADL